MFVAWRRKTLSEKGTYRSSDYAEVGEACACEPTGLGREKLTPVVQRALRVGGKPRTEVICRPAQGIRRCCLESPDDPIARVGFWRAFEHQRDETLRTVDPDASPLLVAAYIGNGGWLRKELAKVVRPPTADEKALAWFYTWPGYSLGSAAEHTRWRREGLAKARERLEAYKQGRRPGEGPCEWNSRVCAEAQAERGRRQAEEREALRRRWEAWVYSPPGTPPPSSPVPADWQQLRDGWLHVEAASRAAGGTGWGWGRAGGASRQAPPSGRTPAVGSPAAAAHVLGLRWPCSADEAKAAFRRGALKAHPDRGGSDAAFVRLKAAYDEVRRGLGAL